MAESLAGVHPRMCYVSCHSEGEMFTQGHFSTSKQNSTGRVQNTTSYNPPTQRCRCEGIWTQTHLGEEGGRTVLRAGGVCIHELSCYARDGLLKFLSDLGARLSW